NGALNSAANSVFTLDFYASSKADPSGYGPGERYLGSTTVTTDASGNASYSAAYNVQTNPDDVLTATATDANGNTSEFSLVRRSNIAPFLEDSDLSANQPTINEGSSTTL